MILLKPFYGHHHYWNYATSINYYMDYPSVSKNLNKRKFFYI